MSRNAQVSSSKYLQNIGVQLLTETFVNDYDGDTLTLNNEETINTKTVIWAAGVTANHMKGLPESSLTRGNQRLFASVNPHTKR